MALREYCVDGEKPLPNTREDCNMATPKTHTHKFEVRKAFTVVNQGGDNAHEVALKKGMVFTARVRTYVKDRVELQDFVVEPDGVLFKSPAHLNAVPCSHTRFLDSDPASPGENLSPGGATGEPDGLC